LGARMLGLGRLVVYRNGFIVLGDESKTWLVWSSGNGTGAKEAIGACYRVRMILLRGAFNVRYKTVCGL